MRAAASGTVNPLPPLNTLSRDLVRFQLKYPAVLRIARPRPSGTATSSPPKFEPLLFLPVSQGRVQCLALIDTGAQVNLIHPEIASAFEITPVPVSFPAIRGIGQTVPVTAAFVTELCFNPKVWVNTMFVVTPAAPRTVILGLPFLMSVKAVINCATRLIRVRGQWLPLVQTQSPPVDPQSVTLNVAIERAESIPSQMPDPTQPTTPPTITGEVPLEIPATPVLNVEERSRLRQALTEFRDLWEGERRGCAIETRHEIKLSTNRPIYSPPRRFPPEAITVIEKELKAMSADGVIRPSRSPYASEIVLVQKKGGTWRMCIDFRLLNKYTIADKYPMPRISDLLRAVQGSRYFVALDLRAGYWQIPMSEPSIPLTAFRSPRGLFEFLVMPFGLTNAPATFQRAMDEIFGDLRYSGVLVYLDDILVHAEQVDEVFRLLHVVFERLRAAGFTLNIGKCSFFPERIDYLGFILTDGKILPNEKRVEALRKLRAPTTVAEVRSILGLLGTFQPFVPNFQSRLAPVSDLLKKTKATSKSSIQWTSLHTQCVHDVVAAISGACLYVPVVDEPLRIMTDASDVGVGAVLQVDREGEWVSVEAVSRKLRDAELNWTTREKEAFAIVFALQKFDHYVRGRAFDVVTDHESLQWLFEAKVGRIARWAMVLSEYHRMRILWKSGKELLAPDCLSRMATDDFVEPRMVYLLTEAAPLPSYHEIVEAQKRGLPQTGRGFSVHEGTTFFCNGVWVPVEYRKKVIWACHALAPFLHGGTNKTIAVIKRVFNWPGLHQDVHEFIKSCLMCQRLRAGPERLQGLLRTTPVEGPFELVFVDLWAVEYQGKTREVLTMLDSCTKWAEATLLPSKHAGSIARAFLSTWVSRYGVPGVLLSDNEACFLAAVEKLSAMLGLQQLRTTVRHPQANPVEAFHRSLQKFVMVALSGSNPPSLDEALQLALYVYRNIAHDTTQETPAFLTFGLDPRPPMDCDWRAYRVAGSARLAALGAVRRAIQERAYARSVQRNVHRNEDRVPLKVSVGDLVLREATPTERATASSTANFGQKLIPRWGLPSRVIAVDESGKSATLQDVFSRHVKHAHLQQLRIIRPPTCPAQEEDWRRIIGPDYPVEGVDWEAVIEPQRSALSTPTEELARPRKRHATARGGH